MFKKQPKIGAQNQLSGKDRKTIKTKLSQIFHPETVQQLLAKNDKIISLKTSGGSKMVIYQGNDYPIFVDGTGKSDFFPTVYTLEAYETFIKFLSINEGVESYIYNGANLMWPGVSSYAQLQNFQKDQVVGIRNCRGQVIGVGAMGCSLKQLQQNSDKSGVAVYILHYRGDKLYEMGPKNPVEVIVKGQKKVEEKVQEKVEQKLETKQEQTEKAEKPSKKKQKKKQQPKKNKQKKQESSSEQSSASEKADSSDDDLDFSSFGNMGQSKKQTQQPEIKVEKKKVNKGFSDDEDDFKKGNNKKKAGKKGKAKHKHSDDQEDNRGQKKEEEAPKSAISSKLMDQYFKQCFLNVLKLGNLEKQLPIDSGRFYIDYMLLARPEGVKLEIKDSSYKKLGKFYDQMSKQKFIEFKHAKDKKGQQGATISKILYENQELRNYEPTIYKLGDKELEKKQEQTETNPMGKKKKLTISKSLDIRIVYKPSKQLRNFLYPRKVNYIPTEKEEEEMKKQEQQFANSPQSFGEHELKALIQERINQINQSKSKNKDKTDKIVGIDYHAHPEIAQLLKKEIEEFEENASDEEQNMEEEQETKKKKDKKKGPKLLKIDRNALVTKLFKKSSTAYRMIDKEQDIDISKEGTFKGISLIAEKANNKNITKMIGLQTFITPKKQAEEQLNWLANVLQQKFACSVNLQNLPGKNAGKELIVHGNFINDLEEMFITQYGIKKQYITMQNKLDKKKKH